MSKERKKRKREPTKKKGQLDIRSKASIATSKLTYSTQRGKNAGQPSDQREGEGERQRLTVILQGDSFDHSHVRFMTPYPLYEWFTEYEIVESTVEDGERWEGLWEPRLGRSGVEHAVLVREDRHV